MHHEARLYCGGPAGSAKGIPPKWGGGSRLGRVIETIFPNTQDSGIPLSRWLSIGTFLQHRHSRNSETTPRMTVLAAFPFHYNVSSRSPHGRFHIAARPMAWSPQV